MERSLTTVTVAAALVVALVVGAVGVGAQRPAATGHEGGDSAVPDDANVYNASNESYPFNFTVVPENRQPGATGVSYRTYSVATDNLPQNPDADGFEVIDNIILYLNHGTFKDCTSFDTTAFGVDYGNNDSGMEVDSNWADNLQDTYFGEDKLAITFTEEGSATGSVRARVDDQVVSRQSGCYANPDEPGWYSAVVYINGTASDGDYSEGYTRSHWFYICDCDSRQEAEQTLGPPPSERNDGGDGATPTASPTPASVTATPTPTAAASPTPTATPQPASPTATASPKPDDDGPTATATSASSPSATAPDDGGGGGGGTPTVGGGPGFGALLALVALLAVGLRGVRR